MKLIDIKDQKIWDAFVAAQPWASFQQSWAWGEFQKSQGREVRRFALMDHNGIATAGQVIYFRRKLSGYWFCPRGPIFLDGTTDLRRSFRHFVEDLLAQDLPGRKLFYRFEPPVTVQNGQGMMPISFRRNHAMSPASTILIDVTQSEDDLLAAMHPKTRYNIRVAEKHDVTVRVGAGEDLDAFLHLHLETAERDEFMPHGAAYLRAMFSFLHERGLARLRLAEQGGQVLAANFEIAFGDTLTYLHGASSSHRRSLMAPYLLHWDAIRHAKSDGHRHYDLWGTNPESQASYYYKPSWTGITRFKQGWGGRQVDLIGTWDLPVHLMMYRLAFMDGMLRG